jgi:large subunit ribosomal protein L33
MLQFPAGPPGGRHTHLDPRPEGETVAKGKEARTTIKLQSSESSYCYFTEKNKNNTKERLQLRKYDPIVRKHVMFKEAGKL